MPTRGLGTEGMFTLTTKVQLTPKLVISLYWTMQLVPVANASVTAPFPDPKATCPVKSISVGWSVWDWARNNDEKRVAILKNEDVNLEFEIKIS